jgi:3-oxoadipate enol-lactonase
LTAPRGGAVAAARPIFIHGSGGGRSVWALQERRFEGAQVLALPGHPRGEGMERAADYAAWAAEEIAAVPAPRAVVGHSLGGAVALELALARPDLVDGLVLVATGARLPVPDHALERVESDFPAECERVVRASFVAEDERRIERSVEAMMATGAETLAGDYRACRAHDARERLAEVRVPTLVISAAEDRLTPVWMGEELARGLPSALMAVIPDASHLLIIEAARAVNLLLAAYLARLELTLDG